MDKRSHWDNVYATKETTAVSWFREHLDPSLEIIDSLKLPSSAAIIDVGGGASTLVDDLLDRGFENITILDIAETALEKTKARLGSRADAVTWTAADVTQVALSANTFDLWHDRAVFHFLTDPDDRSAYVKNLKNSLKAGGHFVIAAFADDGPMKCSGLEVERYDIDKLTLTIGPGFKLIRTFREQHHTPFETVQNFIYAHFRKTD